MLCTFQKPPKVLETLPMVSGAAYIPPALRAKQGGTDAQLEARLRGLLNRLAESNLASIASQVLDIMQREGRGAVSDNITSELLSVSVSG